MRTDYAKLKVIVHKNRLNATKELGTLLNGLEPLLDGLERY